MKNPIEESVGPELKALARHYADGQFNKGEYRERRRHLLQTFLDEPIVEEEEEDEESTHWGVVAQRKPKRWLQLAGLASIVVLGVVVVLL